MDRSFEQDDDPSNLLPDRVGTLIDGKYLVLKLIGHGSTGAVYVCRHVGLDILVALKILHSEMAHNASFVDRFKLEAQAASRLEHPNSVRVRDFGQDASGALFIAMEYIEGRDLLQVLEEDGPFGAERAIDVMAQILDVLGVAHSVGIVHRDLKPENVLLRQVETDGIVRELVTVCDFGIAQFAPVRRSTGTASGTIEVSPELDAIESKVGQAAVVAGTPAYMSPEQARAEPQDARSDLYSAGVVLYQLMTLQLPFFDEDAYALARKHCLEEPPPPSQFGAVSPALEAICLKALSKSKVDRFQSAREMRGALLRVLGPEPEAGRAAAGGAARWRGAFLGAARPRVDHAAAAAASAVLGLGRTAPAATGATYRDPAVQAGAPSHFNQVGQTPLVATTVASESAEATRPERWRGAPWVAGIAGAALVFVLVAFVGAMGPVNRRADGSSGSSGERTSDLRVRVATQQQAARTPPAVEAAAQPDLVASPTGVRVPTNGRSTGQVVEESSIVNGSLPANANLAAGRTNSSARAAVSSASAASNKRADAEHARAEVKETAEAKASKESQKGVQANETAQLTEGAAKSLGSARATKPEPEDARATALRAAETANDIASVERVAKAVLEESAARRRDTLEAPPSPASSKTGELIAFNADAPAVSGTASAANPAGSTLARTYPSNAAPATSLVTPAPQEAKNAQVTIRDVAARAAVSKASVRGSLNMSAITDCYRSSLRAGSAPSGPVTAHIALTASMNGAVAAATLDAPTFPSSLRECIEHVARRGRFRESDTGEAQASVTLAFAPR